MTLVGVKQWYEFWQYSAEYNVTTFWFYAVSCFYKYSRIRYKSRTDFEAWFKISDSGTDKEGIWE